MFRRGGGAADREEEEGEVNLGWTQEFVLFPSPETTAERGEEDEKKVSKKREEDRVIFRTCISGRAGGGSSHLKEKMPQIEEQEERSKSL